MNDRATCNKYYTCHDERTHRVCECKGRIQKIMIEGEVTEMKRLPEKFDSTTSTCVPDHTEQCHIYIDPNQQVPTTG